MPKVIWLTGLPCSGKTTIAMELERMIPGSVRLDGDVLRSGLCSDLGFGVYCRNENIRRAAHLSRLLHDIGHDVICAFVSPRQAHRAFARSMIPDGNFIEVFVATPPSECERRDVKGMWAKARTGEIEQFTGVSAEYEEPNVCEVRAVTDCSPQATANAILEFISDGAHR